MTSASSSIHESECRIENWNVTNVDKTYGFEGREKMLVKRERKKGGSEAGRGKMGEAQTTGAPKCQTHWHEDDGTREKVEE